MTSRRRNRTVLRVMCGFALAVVVGVTGSLSDPATVLARPERNRGIAWTDAAGSLFSLIPPGLLEVLGQGQSISHGGDGVLNVLLMGSDTRTGTALGLTDSIMVFSLKVNQQGNGPLRAASIPRDTGKIPNPFTANTTDTFKGRVNSLLKKLKKEHGSNEVALQKFEVVIEHLLGITIDYHALITFAGFHALVDVVDPISIAYTKEIRDTKYEDDPDPDKPNGVYFPPNQPNYQLYAYQPDEPSQLCNGLFKNDNAGPVDAEYWCRRAMPFVRSRKGSGNSDWKRAGRQQDFVYATVLDVIAGGSSDGALNPLLQAATGQQGASQLRTNIPMATVGDLRAIFDYLKNATRGEQVVFGPNKYATHIPGTTAYKLKLDEVRKWANANLK